MDTLGTDFNNTGSVMSRSQLEEMRRKRGECVKCGQKCFRKKLFKMVPITEPGLVLEGRCLNCRPINSNDDDSHTGQQAVPRRATPADVERFTRSQSNLSSRNLMSSNSSSNMSSRRNISRTHSSAMRSDSRSVGSAGSTSRPQMAGRKPASMKQPKVTDSTTPPLLPRTIASLNPTGGGESQPASVPSQQSTRQVMGVASLPTQEELEYEDVSAELQSGSAFRDRKPMGTAAIRRASHSDLQIGSIARHPLKRSNSGNFPTREELQQAAMTLLAAKHSGIYEEVFQPDELHNLNDQLEHLSTEHAMQYDTRKPSGSYRSLRSGSSLGEVLLPDEIDGFEIPTHGILNRGGSFPLSPALNGGNRGGAGHVCGSSRTLSSMSSMEDDIAISTSAVPMSLRGTAVEAVHEEVDDDKSALSESSARESPETSGRDADRVLNSTFSVTEELPTEQEYLIKLQQLQQDFGEMLIILREGMSSSAVARSGLEKLASLQLSPEEHDILADMGAHHVITEAMKLHAFSLPVQLWGCVAIWNMSGTTRNQIAFVSVGALEVILAAMDRYIDNVDLQEKAIATMSNLGAAANNIATLSEKGAITRIVEAMNKYSEVSTVQIKGCAAVTNLASHDSPFKQTIMERGAGGAVVVAMVMHPEDAYLQEKALRALRNLCANSEANKVELANIGGIDSVISAMQVHRDEVGVQQEGAWTLSNLAGNDNNKAIIGDCGGIDVVIRAMWVHSDNVGVQEWCCRALFTLTLDPRNGNVVLEVGGISAIVNAMQAHVDSPTVQEMGCAVLGNLAGSDQSRMKIVDEEALDAIVLAMVLHSDDIQVQERACMVLLRLTIQPNFKSMQAANIPELVRVAAQKFPEKCDEPAGQLLGALGGMVFPL